MNNTISLESSTHVVVSEAVLGSSDSLCPEDIPEVATADDDEEKELETSPPSPTVVELSQNASVVPGIIQVRGCFSCHRTLASLGALFFFGLYKSRAVVESRALS